VRRDQGIRKLAVIPFDFDDAPAMHAADTSLSVEDAVDVAREAADFVLLERRHHCSCRSFRSPPARSC
jgi:cation transport ATPase